MKVLVKTTARLGITEASEEAARVSALCRRVPVDFTHFLAKDYETMSEACHLYARSVGAIMLDWWRNVWLLRWRGA